MSFVHLKARPVDYVKIGGRYVRGVVVEHAQGQAFARRRRRWQTRTVSWPCRVYNGRGCRLVVRNGYMEKRKLTMGIGPVAIKQPRIDDRKLAQLGEERFSSKILTWRFRSCRAELNLPLVRFPLRSSYALLPTVLPLGLLRHDVLRL